MAEDAAGEDWTEISGEAAVTVADLQQVVRGIPELKRLGWQLLPLTAFTVGMSVLYGGGLEVILPALFMLALVAYFRRQNAKGFVERYLASFGTGEATFTFDGFGFSIESELKQHRLAWSTLARHRELPDSLLVYCSPSTLFVVPKRAFDDEELSVLRQWLEQRIVVPKQPSMWQRTAFLWGLLVVAFLSIWHFLNIDTPRPPNDTPRSDEREQDGPAASGGEDGLPEDD
jgi:hypothetical protein